MANQPKILHVSTPSSWRGGEQQLSYLYEELDKKGVEQYILCRKNGQLAKRGKEKGWNIIEANKITAIDPFFALKIKKTCKKKGINVIHTHDAHAHTFAIIAATLWGNKTPIVVSRRVDFPIKPTSFSRYKYNHPRVKKILCVSSAIKDITAPDIENKSVLSVVHSGIDLERFPHQKELPGRLRKEFNIPTSKSLVGNVAAIAPHKDYSTFINTVEILSQRNVNAHFLIIGTGPEEENIKSLVKAKGLEKWITFTGFREDIPKILPELDVFLITSETEGLGTSVIDAFACKVPVVATEAGGIPELVLQEKTGLISPVKDPVSLANNVERILNQDVDIQDLIEGQQQLLQSFTKESTAEKTFVEYESVLS